MLNTPRRANVAKAATTWYEVSDDMNTPIAEYTEMRRNKPKIPVYTSGASKLTMAIPQKSA